MLRVFRHCIAALLAVTLSAQLIEAQAFACDRMEMTAGAAMDDMPGMVSHEVNPAASPGLTAVAHGHEDPGPASTECDLGAGCLNSSAVPSADILRGPAHTLRAAIADDTSSVSSRTSSPDLPPPRL